MNRNLRSLDKAFKRLGVMYQFAFKLARLIEAKFVDDLFRVAVHPNALIAMAKKHRYDIDNVNLNALSSAESDFARPYSNDHYLISATSTKKITAENWSCQSTSDVQNAE